MRNVGWQCGFLHRPSPRKPHLHSYIPPTAWTPSVPLSSLCSSCNAGPHLFASFEIWRSPLVSESSLFLFLPTVRQKRVSIKSVHLKLTGIGVSQEDLPPHKARVTRGKQVTLIDFCISCSGQSVVDFTRPHQVRQCPPWIFYAHGHICYPLLGRMENYGTSGTRYS